MAEASGFGRGLPGIKAVDSDHFEKLLRSYPDRLAELKKQNGRATKY